MTILGDFNMTTGGIQDSIRPSSGVRAGAEDIEAYHQMMAAAAIMDVWTVLNPRLSSEKSATHREGHRIDRILARHGWLHGGSQIVREPDYLCDHRILRFTCDVSSDVLGYKGPGVWSIPSWLPDLPEFRKFSEPKIRRFLSMEVSGRGLDQFKEQAVADAQAFLRDYGARNSTIQKELRDVFRRALEDQGAGVGDIEVSKAVADRAESLLPAHARHKATEEEREHDVNHRELGDGPTAWFHDRAKPARASAGSPMPDREHGVPETLDRIADHFDGNVPGAMFARATPQSAARWCFSRQHHQQQLLHRTQMWKRSSCYDD